mgnify:CR=1 FL=1
MTNKIIEQFGDFKIVISELQAKQFYDYFEILVETNKFMNLTAITDFDEVVFIKNVICVKQKKTVIALRTIVLLYLLE